jgi:uncharacterized protein YciI
MSDAPTRTLVLYEYVSDILERRAPHREAHLATLRGWAEAGLLIAGGALGEPPHGGALVFSVAPAEVERLTAEDPYVLAGLVTRIRVEPWNVVVRA